MKNFIKKCVLNNLSQLFFLGFFNGIDVAFFIGLYFGPGDETEESCFIFSSIQLILYYLSNFVLGDCFLVYYYPLSAL